MELHDLYKKDETTSIVHQPIVKKNQELLEAPNNKNLYRTILIGLGTYHFGYYIGIMNPLAEPLITHIYDVKSE